MGAADDASLPRMQTGANPQHLITTLLGDYWFSHKEHLPSAALVAAVNEFGITPTSARAALRRLVRRGLLESSTQGRRSFYGLTPQAQQVMREGQQRIFTFGLDQRPWDGTWVVVFFTVPEDQRGVRYALRTRLRWRGLMPLYDAAWVSPRADPDDVVELLEELGVVKTTVLVSRVASATGAGDPLSAWDIDGLRVSYDEFIAAFQPELDRVRDGQVSAAEALIARTAVMDVWRQFPRVDPDLPDDAMPGGWPRSHARGIFAELYDTLGPLADMRFRQIVGTYSPELARKVRHHTTKSARRRKRS